MLALSLVTHSSGAYGLSFTTGPACVLIDASDPAALPSVEVTGIAVRSGRDVSQSIDSIDAKELAEQNLTLVQDALRNVPGVTLNSGEGGAHGDSVNLRGLSIPDSFFMDGVRDIGQYRRDTFNAEAIAVLLGPASAVFGRGSTSGVINSISKQPLLTPLTAFSVSAGEANLWRATGDLNVPVNATTAARLTVMDQRNGVVQRDQVLNRSYGLAPTLALGIGTPTRLTLSYFKEVENNIPDYGIPFVDGAVAHVDRNNYYGLVNYDRTRTNTNIGTLRVERDLTANVALSDSLRYANYGFEYLVDGPFLGNGVIAAPPPGTPYADIAVYRDQPSSAGTTSLAINRTDLTAKVELANVTHTFTSGLELSEEQSHVSRFENGLNQIAPTSLLAPDPFNTAPTPLIPYSNPKGRGSDVSVYAVDSMAFGPHWDMDVGVRWDRFKSSFSEAFSGTRFERTDTFLSPRAALIYKPDEAQSYYASYGCSYNPVIEYLIVAPSNVSLSPEKNSTFELGVKAKIVRGGAELTAAVFDTRVKNVRISDPDNPTVQEMPFDQRVKGIELGVNGYLTDKWEMTATYTHLNDRITTSSNFAARGKWVPNTPRDGLNLWTALEPTTKWSVAGGFSAVSQRYADTENTAGVPSYVVFNAMAAYQVSRHCKLQVNLNNVTDKLYFTGFYYTGVTENHALPSAGRTLVGTATYRF